jgi:hypothetical protein
VQDYVGRSLDCSRPLLRISRAGVLRRVYYIRGLSEAPHKLPVQRQHRGRRLRY